METDPRYQAILAHPENDDLRLVYADALEDRGDVRGEFIRMQCSLAKMSPFDDRWSECVARERRLLYQHGETWCKPWSQVLDRGFVAGLNQYQPAGIAQWGPAFFEAHPIDRIWFYYQESPGWGPAFAACEFLRRLRTIWFGGRSASIAFDDIVAMLDSPHLSNLESFCFTGDSLEGLDAGTFPDLISQDGTLRPALRNLKAFSLDLWGNGVMNRASLETLVASDLSNTLTCLSLKEQFQINTVALQVLANSRLWERLLELDLGFQRAVPKHMADAWARSRLDRLRVSINSNHFASLFLTAAKWGELTHLDLDNTEIQLEDYRSFVDHPSFARLLAFSHDMVLTAQLEWLANSPHSAGLRSLGLGMGYQQGDGLLALSRSPFCRNLCELSINNVTVAGIEALTSSSNFSRLHTLSIQGDDLGPIYAALAKAENLPNLTNLTAFSATSRLGEESIPELVASPHRSRLSYLEVFEPQTDACRQALRDAEQIVWLGPHVNDIHRRFGRKHNLFPRDFFAATPRFFWWKPDY